MKEELAAGVVPISPSLLWLGSLLGWYFGDIYMHNQVTGQAMELPERGARTHTRMIETCEEKTKNRESQR